MFVSPKSKRHFWVAKGISLFILVLDKVSTLHYAGTRECFL